jgi:hypothetical protein
MTATSTMHPRTTNTGHRWGLLGALAAGGALVIATAVVIADDDDTRSTAVTDPVTQTVSGITLSADAAERWVAGDAPSGPRSADAAERSATHTYEARVLECTSGTRSADAVERCLAGI